MIRRKEDEVEREDTDRVAQANCYCQLEIVVNYCVLALKVELENVLYWQRGADGGRGEHSA